MRKVITLSAIFLTLFYFSEARIRYVDKNGGKDQYGQEKKKTIQEAIDAALEGDTVRIYPGVYNESINVGKNIVVQGAGILSTNITSDNSQRATVVMTAGKIMWISITSTLFDGINLKSATVSNCLIYNCNNIGIYVQGIEAKMFNSIIYNNNDIGIYCTDNGNLLVVNCVSAWNKKYGIQAGYWVPGYGNPGNITARYCNSYGNGGNFYQRSGVLTLINCKEVDPGFSPDAWRLSSSSLLKDSGDPNIFDLDGTRSDMGYWGGPDAPLIPYLTFPQNYILNPDGSMQFDFEGKVGY